MCALQQSGNVDARPAQVDAMNVMRPQICTPEGMCDVDEC